MKRKNVQNILKGGQLVFLILTNVIVATADYATVMSKQDNLSDGGGRNTKSRVFLKTSDAENERANAYTDIKQTNRFIALQEFADMIQIGDVIEYNKPRTPFQDGRYLVITEGHLLNLNGRNIYELFINELQDDTAGHRFYDAREAYRAANRTSMSVGNEAPIIAKAVTVPSIALLPARSNRGRGRGE